MQKTRIKGLWAALLAVVMLFTLTAMPAHAEASDWETTADSSTHTSWTNTLADESDVNAGRIWTDKSVWSDADLTDGTLTLFSKDTSGVATANLDIEKTDGADFMVGLSALSSTSSETSTVRQPLDITLVLDVSGSMGNNITVGGGSKLSALKNAVEAFLEETDTQNQAITEEDQKNRVALIQFAGKSSNDIGDQTGWSNETRIVCDFTTEITEVSSSVSKLRADGSTAADYAFQQVNRLLRGDGNLVGKRPGAKQVVIFFTDGEPNHGDGFQKKVASDAITEANAIKAQEGATIYTIGVYKDVDPSKDPELNNTSNINKFLHAVSSNYSNATLTEKWNDDWEWNWGTDGAYTNGYYLGTDNSDGLTDIFQQILESEIAGLTPPTQTDEAQPAASGWITFTDTLGDFMEVKGMNALVYAGEKFETVTTSESQDPETRGWTKYTFTRLKDGTSNVEGNEIYGPADTTNVNVVVNPDGNVVKVEIPATMIPLRYYDIDADTATMKITEALPIRLFYSVGLKDDVVTAMQGSSEQVKAVAGLEDYIEDNTDSATNQVYFYSNAFTKNASAGLTTASFTPNDSNSFYYFQEDTPVYQDANGTSRVTAKPNVNDTVYYPVTYYVNEGTTTKQITSYVAVQVTQEVLDHNFFGTDADGVVITQDSPKITKPASFAAGKTGNETGTAANAVEPSWDSAYDQVNVALGNNGRIAVPAPTPDPVTISEATGNGIKVQKTVTGAANAGPFEFKLTLKSAMDGTTAITDGVFTDATATTAFPTDGMTLSLSTFAAGETKTGTFDAITFTKEGTYTFTVDETTAQPDPANGWTYDTSTHDVTVTVTKSTTENKLEATVAYAAGADTDATAACFTNSYKADPVTLGEGAQDALGVTKVVTGADAKEAFDFELKLTSNNAANVTGLTDNKLTAATSGNIQDGGTETVTFGDLTFKAEGTYTFEVKETSTAPNSGWTYDNTPKTITVTVTDEGNDGQLDAAVTGNNPTITNRYEADPVTLGEGAQDALGVTKVVTGANTDDDFTFALTLKEASVENGVFEDANAQTAFDGMTLTLSDAFTKDIPQTGTFGALTFTKEGTYTFEVKETTTATANSGWTYDNTPKTITVTVTDDGHDGQLDADVEDNNPTVTNSYKAAPVTLGEGSESALGVTKVVTGADTDADFAFELTLKEATVQDGVFEDTDAKTPFDGMTLTLSETFTEDTPQSGTFGAITFTKEGTYTFEVKETTTATANSGWTYDNTPKTITVTVTDDGHDGQLDADVEDNNPTVTNSYKAGAGTLNGADKLKVSKAIEGRGWLQSDQFTFKLTNTGKPDGVAEAPMPTEDTLTLNYANRMGAFGNIQFAVPGTYTYTISETGSDAVYLEKDETVYTVTVTVTDDGSGTLQVESSMTPGSDNVAAFTNTYNGDDDPKKDVTVNADTTSGNGSLVGVGDELTYTIDWTNTAVDENGNAAAATVTVTDVIPAGTELLDANGGTNNNGTITWTIPDADPHATGTVSFKVRVTEDAVDVDTISNTASVQIGNNAPTISNTVENYFPKKEDITQPVVTEIQVGDELTYQISFHNKEAGTVEVVDTLAQGLEYVTGTAHVDGVSMEPSLVANQLSWNVQVQANTDTTITFRVEVTRAALVTVDNKATVGGHTTNTVTTPVPTDDAKHVSKNGVQVDGQLVVVGDTLTYTINWANDSTTDGTVTITDTLPAGLTVKADTILDGGSYDGNKTITWNLTGKKAGERGTVQFEAVVTAEALNGIIENNAKVNNHAEVSVTNYVNTKTVEEPEGGVKVGSELTYTIHYANATDAPATVIVTDRLSEGLTYVSADVTPTSTENNTLVWTIENVPAKTTGIITFKAVVNENAVKDTIENKAQVQVGNDPAVETNTTETTLGTGSLAISKTVKWAETGDQHKDQEFSFQVILTDSQNNPLTGEYQVEGNQETVKSGGIITLTDGDTKTIVGLPEGTKYTVTEISVAGYKAEQTTISGEVTEGADPAAADFVNTYATSPVTVGGEGDASLTVHKNFIGRDWTEGDSFSFTLSAAEGDANAATVLDEPKKVTIDANTQDYSAGFGELTFDKVGDYTFTVQEVIPDDAVENVYNGITYDADAQTLLIHVIDKGDGTLSAYLDNSSDTLTFTNSYDANFPDPEDPDNPDITSGLVQIPVSKDMDGDRTNLLDGESYDFTITPNADKSTVLSDLIPEATNGTLTLDKNTPKDLFEVDFSDVHDLADLAKALMKQVAEGPAADMQSVDIATAESAMATSETAAAESDGNGTDLSVDSLNVATMSLEDVAALNADQAKTLLEQICGDYYYTIAESSTEMGGGVTKDLTTYEVKITMKHDGAGTLYLEKPVITKVTNSDGSEIAEADRPQVETAAFVNTYTLQNDTVSLSITGSKELTGRALEKDEFTFVLQDATTGEIVAQTTNEADGSFTFDLSYTKDQIRKYGYTVTEVVGSDAQITYDKTSYAVQVNVYDDNNGNLKAEATLPESGLVFRNTYTAPAQEQEETPTTPKPTPVPSAAPTATPAPASVIPQTGDNFPYALLIVLLCAAAAGFGIAFYANKRKNKH